MRVGDSYIAVIFGCNTAVKTSTLLSFAQLLKRLKSEPTLRFANRREICHCVRPDNGSPLNNACLRTPYSQSRTSVYRSFGTGSLFFA